MSTEPDWWTTPPYINPTANMGATQRRILAYLAEHDRQSFTMGAIAKALGMPNGQAHRGARSLVSRGFLEITTPVGPGRVRHVHVTAAGKARIKAVAQRAQ